MALTAQDFIGWFHSDAGQAFLAGAAGGAIRWVTLRERPRDGAVSLIVGAVCAIYLGPLVEPFLSPLVGKISPTEDAAGFAAFVVGIGGISLTGAVIDIFRGVSLRAKSRAGGTSPAPGDVQSQIPPDSEGGANGS